METTLILHDQEGKAIGTIPFQAVLPEKMETAILWQANKTYLANQRQGTADTKTRSEVSGGGKKPWRQKHTGRARAGSNRSPLWRKGGIVFGPHPRDYHSDLPEKMRRRALAMGLKARLQDQAVLAVEGFDALPAKTKALAQFLKQMKVTGGALLVVEKSDPRLFRISRNLPKVVVKCASDVTSLDLLKFPHVVVTKQALRQLESALQ